MPSRILPFETRAEQQLRETRARNIRLKGRATAPTIYGTFRHPGTGYRKPKPVAVDMSEHDEPAKSADAVAAHASEEPSHDANQPAEHAESAPAEHR